LTQAVNSQGTRHRSYAEFVKIRGGGPMDVQAVESVGSGIGN
jgi:hypothetical protein